MAEPPLRRLARDAQPHPHRHQRGHVGFVALIPFTTDALGDPDRGAIEVTTVVYATNIAIVSAIATVLYAIARRDGLFRHAPSDEEARLAYIDQSVPTAVFVLSIPIAVLVSGAAARWCWLSLAVLGPVSGRWIARRRAADRDMASGPDRA